MKKKQVVCIKEIPAGNETVGEAWKETKSFKETDPISKIIKWAFGEGCPSFTRRRNVIITIADNETNK